jgi:ATP-binding cassette, subfamily F, member 3
VQIQGLKKEFGEQVLFENVTLSINPGERIGLVGRNGSGKSTFFKILLGELTPDAGEARVPKGYRLGALSQHIKFSHPTLLEEASESLAPELMDQTHQVEKILFGLGFTKADLTRDPWSFSGGYQVRLNLAKALLKNPNLLLLDEPTNYLDILSLRWLKKFLKSFEGEVILITHDRGFMDDVVTHIVGITRRSLRKIKGTTENYYQTIAQEEELYEKTRLNQEKKRKDMESFVERFRAKATKAAQAQSRLKQLEKMEVFDALENERLLNFRFRQTPCPGKNIMDVEGLSFAYPGGEKLFENVSFTLGKNDRVAIIGKNGKGKSTLLNVLAGNLEPVTGKVSFHPSLSLGHFGQTNVDRLRAELTIEDEIRASNGELSRSEVRGIAGLMMFEGELAQKQIKVLSGGERSRVLLGKILSQKSNLLFLDEPTNHLDMESVEALIEAIERFEGAVCIVTHNEELLQRVANRLLVFRQGGCESFLGTYDDFLEKVGWDEEREGAESSEKAKRSSKELRHLRSQLVLERSRELKPLLETEEELEAVIIKLEELLKVKEASLIELSQLGEGEKIANEAQELAQLREKVDLLFEKLESVSVQKEEITAKFEAKLSELGD